MKFVCDKCSKDKPCKCKVPNGLPDPTGCLYRVEDIAPWEKKIE
jgi:hypothetical protein